MSKEQKLLNKLLDGYAYTRTQVKAQFKLKNPSAAIHRLKTEGFKIKADYTTKKIKGVYKTTVKYSI